MRKEYEIQVRWTAFPLHPEIPAEGLTLRELFAGSPVDIAQVKARLRRVAEELGLPLGDRDRTYNTRLAHELGKWAEEQGKGDEFHNSVFRAYFARGENIGTIPVLENLARSIGLRGEEAREVLEAKRFSEAVDLDWNRSRALGVTAVPTFLIGQRAMVGAQPYENLEKLMAVSGVKRRSPVV